MQRRLLHGLFSLGLLIFLPAASAVESLRLLLQEPVLEGQGLRLKWWVEGLRGKTVESAELEQKPLSAQVSLEPTRGQPVCYLLLLDSSQSMPTGVGRKAGNISLELVKALVQAKPAQHWMGLMTFGQAAELVAPPAQDTAALLGALDKLRFNQARTELIAPSKPPSAH